MQISSCHCNIFLFLLLSYNNDEVHTFDSHSVHYIKLLVFSRCFRAGFRAFSTLKYKVRGDTNSCNLWAILKLNTYLIFTSRVVVHFVCHY